MSFFSSTRRLHCTPRVLRTQASIGLCALLDARRLLCTRFERRRLHCTPRVLRTRASIGLCALLDARRLLALASSIDEFNSCAVFARATLDDNNNNNNNNDFIYRGNSVGVIQSSLRSSLQHSTYVHKDTKQQKNKIYKII